MTAFASSIPPSPPFAKTSERAIFSAALLAELLNVGELRVGVGSEAVQRDDDRQTEFREVFYVRLEVDRALLQRVEVFFSEFRLRHAAVVFERADGRDQARRRSASDPPCGT